MLGWVDEEGERVGWWGVVTGKLVVSIGRVG